MIYDVDSFTSKGWICALCAS